MSFEKHIVISDRRDEPSSYVLQTSESKSKDLIDKFSTDPKKSLKELVNILFIFENLKESNQNQNQNLIRAQKHSCSKNYSYESSQIIEKLKKKFLVPILNNEEIKHQILLEIERLDRSKNNHIPKYEGAAFFFVKKSTKNQFEKKIFKEKIPLINCRIYLLEEFIKISFENDYNFIFCIYKEKKIIWTSLLKESKVTNLLTHINKFEEFFGTGIKKFLKEKLLEEKSVKSQNSQYKITKNFVEEKILKNLPIEKKLFTTVHVEELDILIPKIEDRRSPKLAKFSDIKDLIDSSENKEKKIVLLSMGSDSELSEIFEQETEKVKNQKSSKKVKFDKEIKFKPQNFSSSNLESKKSSPDQTPGKTRQHKTSLGHEIPFSPIFIRKNTNSAKSIEKPYTVQNGKSPASKTYQISTRDQSSANFISLSTSTINNKPLFQSNLPLEKLNNKFNTIKKTKKQNLFQSKEQKLKPVPEINTLVKTCQARTRMIEVSHLEDLKLTFASLASVGSETEKGAIISPDLSLSQDSYLERQLKLTIDSKLNALLLEIVLTLSEVPEELVSYFKQHILGELNEEVIFFNFSN